MGDNIYTSYWQQILPSLIEKFKQGSNIAKANVNGLATLGNRDSYYANFTVINGVIPSPNSATAQGRDLLAVLLQDEYFKQELANKTIKVIISKDLQLTMEITSTNAPAFFTEADFIALQQFNGVVKQDGNTAHQQTYDALKQTYDKVEYWNKQVQAQLFPNGATKLVKKPTNQASRFEEYQWGKIYPTQELLNQKILAYTLTIDAYNRFIVKIDTVGLDDKDARRKKYFDYRGEYENSSIVKIIPKQQVLDKSWKYLIDLSVNDVMALQPHFDTLKNLLLNTPEEKIIQPQLSNMPLNTILYGPPGTGKTYNTINKALEILGYDIANKERKTIKEEFDKRVIDKQIVFTTFHQSMSYEDFIEGIKPKTVDGKVVYEIEDGIFKKLATKAFDSIVNNNISQPISNDVSPTFDQLHQAFLLSIKDYAGKDEYIFKTIYQHDIKLVEINDTTIVVMFKWQDVKKQIPATQKFSITKDKLKQLFDGGLNPKDIKSLKESFAPYMKHNLSVFYAVYKKFYDFIENKLDTKTIEAVEVADDYSFEELNELWNLKKQEDKDEAIKGARNYVLIIDEINRGNISQIFGELITLIEDDKRLGKHEALSVTLPYSKESFSVPNNLYIIGTMNTADRSVEALDTALRRRFVFEEMMPKPSIIQEVFEEDFLLMCALHYNIPFNEADWKACEKHYIDFIPSDLYEKFNVIPPKKESISALEEELKVLWHSLKIEILTVKISKKINERIALLLSRDHLIGHSYFIGKYTWAALQQSFHKNIIPLLQEYFYGDYGKIGLVLGEGFFDVIDDSNANSKSPFAKFGNYETAPFLEKPKYVLQDVGKMEVEDFKAAINTLLQSA